MSKDICQRPQRCHNAPEHSSRGCVSKPFGLTRTHGQSHNLQLGKLTYAASIGAAHSPCICMLAMVISICSSLVTHTQSIVQMATLHLHTCCCPLKRRKACRFARVPAIRQQISLLRAKAANSKRAMQSIGCDPEVQKHLCPADKTSLDPHCSAAEPHLIPTSAQTSTK